MKIVKIQNTKKYIKFIRELYKNDIYYKDNKSDVINMICNKCSSYFYNSKQEMVGVVSNGKLQCQCVLIQHKNLSDTLIIAFFEAYPDCKKEVDYLIDYTRTKAVQWNCKKILVGINGHCNYGLGMLNSNFDEPADFPEEYNPKYYNDYFKDKFKVYNFCSFKNSLIYGGKQIENIKNKLNNQDIIFEKCNLQDKNFKDIVKTYTDLNNEIFKNHFYYYKRKYEEDLELFTSMQPLLCDNNLIIAYKDEIPIGFLFWYPNFNELVQAKRKINFFSLIKYKFFKQKPKQIMLTEIGVLPQYEKSGLIISLFSELYDYLYNEYDKNCIVHSGWIYDENLKSKSLVHHILNQKSKEFCVYELTL